MALFHCSLAWLEPGSVIQPGNYGRILSQVGANHTAWLREQFLEHVRLHEFPDKPSRLTSAFACDDMDAVQLFKEQNCPTGIIYEVVMTNPHANQHVTDYNCIQPIPGKIEDMTQIARYYWSASCWFDIDGRPGLKCAETLVDCGLRIVKEV